MTIVNGKTEKKKFLFVSWESLSGDVAWQLKKEGHEVKCYIKAEEDQDVYDGFIEKVDDWKKWVEWSDCIIFDDIWFGKEAEELRKSGKLVFGGSVYTDKLEDDREFGQQEMESAGINTLPRWNFTNFEEAIKFIKEHPDRYVFKPAGRAQNEKELLFVGNEEDGSDIVGIFEKSKKELSKKIKTFQLQKFASGVEVAVGAFFNGKEFIYPINVNFEHKRMFPGDLGPNTGEMGTLVYFCQPNALFDMTLHRMKQKLAKSGYVGYVDINCIANAKGIYPLEFTCFDERTEILTKEGWKTFEKVLVGDFTLSINTNTRELSWKKITNKTVLNYSGEMVKIGAKNKSHSALDILVTPEHKLIVENSGHIKFVRAAELKTHTKIIRNGNWNCITEEYIDIPEHTENHFLGKYKKYMKIVHPKKSIKTENFMRFLGLYLAEGSFLGKHGKDIPKYYSLSIAQSPHSRHRKDIEKILTGLDFSFKVQKSGAYQISSVQLCNFLVSLGMGGVRAGEKFVPKKFKDFNPKFLWPLIEGFAIGDGSVHRRTGQLSLFTTSKQLADDIQEIIIKCGKLANLQIRKQKGTLSIGGYKRKNDIYTLSLREKKTDYWLDNRTVGREYYDGKIWDVEVEDWHTMLVRRNGKPFFSGNCRMGYPHISIAMEGISMPIGEMILKLASGENFELKIKRGFQIGVVLAVPPFPFDDQKVFSMYKDSTIYFKKPNFEGVHLGDVKIVEGDWKVAGASGYVLVITGVGTTVEEARKQAYSRVSNIFMPSMFYRTDIGMKWYGESDKLQTWGYLY